MNSQILKRTYRFRLYPNKKQEKILENQLTLCRWLYNYFLAQRRDFFKEKKISISCYQQIKELPELKKERPELRKVYPQVLQEVTKRVDRTFQNFFQRIKAKQKAGYPRFKGKRRYDSFTYPQNGFEIKEGKLKLSRIGEIKIKPNRKTEGKIKTLTIRKTSTQKWFASIVVELNKELPEKKPIKEAIGIDMGLNSFLTTDKGEKVENLRYLVKSENKLAKIQRWHSKKKLKSSNRQKSRLKLAKIHEKIKNQRIDFLHQLSRKLVNNFQLIAFEKLNVKGMLKNKYLSRSISDASWNRFLEILKYKAAEAGIWAVEVNSKNTSQVCSGCGNIVPKTLAVRKHKCPNCKLEIDRDINAARNILNLALNTVGATGIKTCGVGRWLPTMKQEVE